MDIWIVAEVEWRVSVKRSVQFPWSITPHLKIDVVLQFNEIKISPQIPTRWPQPPQMRDMTPVLLPNYAEAECHELL